MIKRIFLCLLFLLACNPYNPPPADAFGPAIQAVLSAGGVSVQTDSCTGALLFSWHMENDDVTLGGVAGGVNNGCSDNDTTATRASAAAISDTQAQDGTYSLSCPTSLDNAAFSIPTGFSTNTGTVVLYVYVTTFFSDATLFRAYVDAQNYISIILKTSAETTSQIRGVHMAGNTARLATSAYTGGIPSNQWLKVIFKWSNTAVSGKYLSLTIDDANEGSATLALGSWEGSLSTMVIGEVAGNPAAFFLDDIKVYNTWQ